MYATKPIFDGEERRLYRESRFMKIVTEFDYPNNAPVYGKERDISCLMLVEDDFILESTQIKPVAKLDQQLRDCSKV